MEFFLQQAAALSHLNDRVIEAVEALRELASAKLQRRLQVLWIPLLEPLKDNAQARQLPMQTDAASPQPAELLAKIDCLVRQYLFFDLVERLRDAVGNTYPRHFRQLFPATPRRFRCDV